MILNCVTPSLKKIPKENVLGIACEPVQFLNLYNGFIDYAKEKIGIYYIGEKGTLPEPFVENHGFMLFQYNAVIKQIPLKTKLMSIIFSNKTEAPGHKYRHTLVENILGSDLNIDIFGLGCENLKLIDSRIKGTFVDSEPYQEYFFSITIENFRNNDYISEKFLNCLAYNVTPLYLGAKNIHNYFPNQYIKLSGNLDEDLKIIIDVSHNPSNYIKIINRQDMFNKMNLIPHLLKIFE